MLMARLVSASRAIKYAKHAAAGLVCGPEHSTDPSTALITWSLRSGLLPGQARAPSHPHAPIGTMLHAVPLHAPHLMPAPSSADYGGKGEHSHRDNKINHLS